ncbi:hypothetical protein [Neptuniibacter halophilus]|uniref:hypothetical protein n=1 Tax=Neptuniibacter halophilus TaxID=651666 RepID=UPI00257326F7|nr:hypothetical protein [Neptuniibacter halophilus]
MKAGDKKIFTKSGNEVRLIERSGDGWIVERTKGRSAGKQMWCPERALVNRKNSGLTERRGSSDG